MKRIDLRSDTVTLPSPQMREAMYRAELGDDVFGEDPTVNRLQEMAAPMGNLVSVLTHCQRGDGVILGDQSHILLNEAGGSAALGGVYLRVVPNLMDGTIDPAAIERAIPTEDVHHPRIRLITLENTHNYCQGTPLDPAYVAQIGALAHRHGLALHVDGARIFNAAIALGVKPSDLAAPADSVMFCLSKGLSCPVGSLVCGSAEFIHRAHRMRKMVGGGMRQAGVLAAAGVVALEHMVDRLQEDHDNARLLAEGIAEIPGLALDPKTVRTNIVFFDFVASAMTTDQFVAALAESGVLLLALGPGRLRVVTHYGINASDVSSALQVMRQVLAGKA